MLFIKTVPSQKHHWCIMHCTSSNGDYTTYRFKCTIWWPVILHFNLSWPEINPTHIFWFQHKKITRSTFNCLTQCGRQVSLWVEYKEIECILLGQSSRDNRWEGPAFELTCHLPVSVGKLSEYRTQVTNKEALPVSTVPEPHTVILSFKKAAHTHTNAHIYTHFWKKFWATLWIHTFVFSSEWKKERMVARTRVMHGANALLLTYGLFQPACVGVYYTSPIH